MKKIFKALRRIQWNSMGTHMFLAVHLLGVMGLISGICFAPIPFTWNLFWAFFLGYTLRMLVITMIGHRYFSHKTFEWNGEQLKKVADPVSAFLFTLAIQRGVIWWSSNHRMHHRYSDEEGDPHPSHDFWNCHIGWILSDEHVNIARKYVGDLIKNPALMWVERNYLLGPLLMGIVYFLWGWLTAVGGYHNAFYDGMYMVTVGMFLSTVFVWHGTFSINSLSHRWGNQRYTTGDQSRNNWILALITHGEGWHNNHHHRQYRARSSEHWWEIDLTWYVIWLCQKLGLLTAKA